VQATAICSCDGAVSDAGLTDELKWILISCKYKAEDVGDVRYGRMSCVMWNAFRPLEGDSDANVRK
jgi:hypothetical protein